MSERFQGFCNETFDFLYGLYFNNERLWFQAHKEEYRTYLYRPMKALAGEVFRELTTRFPQKELRCKVTRIYRDARIYRGISCFKESLWFSILGPCESPSLSPSMWFDLSRESWSYGMGLYHPSAAAMARHRAAIDADPRPLSDLYEDILGQREFTLRGESYRKLRPCSVTQLAGWYNMKNFEVSHYDMDIFPLYDGPQTVQRLVDGFTFLMPYFDYFYPLSDAAHMDE